MLIASHIVDPNYNVRHALRNRSHNKDSILTMRNGTFRIRMTELLNCQREGTETQDCNTHDCPG